MKVKHFDYIKQGKVFKHSKPIPLVPPKEEILYFKDSLIKIIPIKLKELLEKRDRLIEKREEALGYVKQKTKAGSGEEYFLALLAEHEFSEVYVIQKWVKYWLDLWYEVTDKLAPKRLQEKLSMLSEFEIEKAKQNPLEDLYEGQLRKYGSKLAGLCVFHKERTPSFFIFPDNHFHCYGCGEHGDAISFVMKIKGLTFPEAVRYLL